MLHGAQVSEKMLIEMVINQYQLQQPPQALRKEIADVVHGFYASGAKVLDAAQQKQESLEYYMAWKKAVYPHYFRKLTAICWGESERESHFFGWSEARFGLYV